MRKEPLTTNKSTKFFKVILIAICAVFTSLSWFSFEFGQNHSLNLIGLLGQISITILNSTFGLAGIMLPIYLWMLCWLIYKNKSRSSIRNKSLVFLALTISSAFLLTMLLHDSLFIHKSINNKVYVKNIGLFSYRYYWGGIPFKLSYEGWKSSHISLKSLIGVYGSFVLFFVSFTVSLLYLINIRKIFYKNIKKASINLSIIRKPLSFIKRLISNMIDMLSKKPYFPATKQTNNFISFIDHTNKQAEPKIKNTTITVITKPTISGCYKQTPAKHERPPLLACKHNAISQETISTKSFSPPQPHLLTVTAFKESGSSKQLLTKQAEILKETLSNFGIDVNIGHICCGPTLTSFEVIPQPGVKVQKIKALENDIALNMQAKSLRIIAPIPGKAAVGIEIPNAHPQEVNFRELLENYSKQPKQAFIPLLLGKKSDGEHLISDLSKMPHLIIAGATGSGKSVCINTIVMSIIMTNSPNDIKLMMVDPKKVELSSYTNLPHMLTPVITEAEHAHTGLTWLVKEMETRYELLRLLGIRNIQGFNSRKKDLALESSLDMDIPDKLPFIVCIIDELADLILSSSQDVETPIIRIAQMARAVGIHMILATQRPSREVITGLIKANFPSRIAFKVASRVNSQIIIDEAGAETLIGNGDMLVLTPGSSGVIRAQGAFIRDDDINKVIKDICNKYPTNYIIPSFDKMSQNRINVENKDVLFSEAKKIVIETGNASTTFLQRKLKIGYARAASLMDELEESGIIGPADGSKPRRIFYKKINN